MRAEKLFIEDGNSELALRAAQECVEKCKKLLESSQAFVLLYIDEEGKMKGETHLSMRGHALALSVMCLDVAKTLVAESKTL